MVARRRIFRKAADDFLEHIAHLDIVDFFGIEFEFGELFDNAQQTVVFVKILDFFLKLQFFKDRLDIR